MKNKMKYVKLIDFATNAEAIVAFKVICEGFGSPFHLKLIEVLEETQNPKAAWIAAHLHVATLNATMETEGNDYLQSQDFASVPDGVSSVSNNLIHFDWISRSGKDYRVKLDLSGWESSLTISYDPQSSMKELFESLVSN
jgi:hypothetical protein